MPWIPPTRNSRWIGRFLRGRVEKISVASLCIARIRESVPLANVGNSATVLDQPARLAQRESGPIVGTMLPVTRDGPPL
jgi:hypothetical protein